MEQTVEFENDGLLKGMLSIPDAHDDSPLPAVVFIPGSGPLDKDENVKRLKLNVFNRLAESLAEQGIASLRYDKRGTGESDGSFHQTGVWDLINDALAAVNFLKTHPSINSRNIFILGHSEGGMIAPEVANKVSVKGVIMLASTVSPLIEVLTEQSERFEREVREGSGFLYKFLRVIGAHKNTMKKQKKFLEKTLNHKKDYYRSGGVIKVNAKWFQEHNEYKPADSLKNLHVPLLAVNGSKDIQVSGEGVSEIAQLARGPAEVHVIDNMNHILRLQEEPESLLKMKKLYKKYGQKEIAPPLLDILQPWLIKNILD